MKTELNDVSPVKKTLSIEIPAADVATVFDKILRQERKKARIPGFRPGKAPLERIRALLGAGLGREATDHILQFFGQKAIAEEGLQPIHGGVYIEFEGDERELPPAVEGEDYSFTLGIETMPEVAPENYEGLKVNRPEVKVEDEEIQRELDQLRESRSTVEAVEGRSSQDGDLVAVDIEGAEEGGDFKLEREERTIRLGADGNLPEFERGLVGLAIGDSFSFDVTYPDDYPGDELKGKTVVFKGEVKGLQEMKVPELTDELVKEISEEFENVEALKTRVREFVEARKKREADQAARRALIDRLLDDNPFEIPGSMIEQEVKARLEEMGRRMAAQGIDPEQANFDWQKIIEEERGNAERAIRETLILDVIGEKEGLEAEQADVDAALQSIAQDGHKDVAELRKSVKGEALQNLKRQILRSKTVDWLYDKSQIV